LSKGSLDGLFHLKSGACRLHYSLTVEQKRKSRAHQGILPLSHIKRECLMSVPLYLVLICQPKNIVSFQSKGWPKDDQRKTKGRHLCIWR